MAAVQLDMPLSQSIGWLVVGRMIPINFGFELLEFFGVHFTVTEESFNWIFYAVSRNSFKLAKKVFSISIYTY